MRRQEEAINYKVVVSRQVRLDLRDDRSEFVCGEKFAGQLLAAFVVELAKTIEKTKKIMKTSRGRKIGQELCTCWAPPTAKNCTATASARVRTRAER